MLIWEQTGGKEGGGRGETEVEKEREGREAQAQEKMREEGLDIHFRIPSLGISVSLGLCHFVMPHFLTVTKADNYAFNTRSLSYI